MGIAWAFASILRASSAFLCVLAPGAQRGMCLRKGKTLIKVAQGEAERRQYQMRLLMQLRLGHSRILGSSRTWTQEVLMPRICPIEISKAMSVTLKLR